MSKEYATPKDNNDCGSLESSAPIAKNGVLSFAEGFFATNIHPSIIEANRELIDRVSGYNGHIVLRVTPGGKSFYVYMLDDSNFKYKVKSIHGPYQSK